MSTAVTQQEFVALGSEYLRAGYLQDQLEIAACTYDGAGRLRADLRVKNHWICEQHGFHLSAQTALQWVQQLAVVLAGLDLRLSRRGGEVLLRKLDVKFKRAITSDRDLIPVELEVMSKRSLGTNVVYEMSMSVGNGAFSGEGSFLYPLPDSGGVASA